MFRDPFGESLVENAGEVNEGTEKTAFLHKTFSEKIGKGLTKQNANVLLEIFPLVGSGSLKFTLCD